MAICGLMLTIINNSEAESSHEKSRIHKPYFYFQEFMNEFRTSKLCAKVHTYRHILTHVHNYTSGERCHHFQIFLWRGGGKIWTTLQKNGIIWNFSHPFWCFKIQSCLCRGFEEIDDCLRYHNTPSSHRPMPGQKFCVEIGRKNRIYLERAEQYKSMLG